MPRTVLALVVGLAAAATAAAATPAPAPLTDIDRLTLNYATGETFALPLDGWRIAPGDDPAAVAPGFDDGAWRAGKVDLSLFSQGFKPRGWYTYRCRFTLPEDFAGADLLLDLGMISVADEVYLNGRRCGGYGEAGDKPTVGASWVARRYLLPAAEGLLRPGENLLAVRVFTGYAGGMYNGKPSLAKVNNNFHAAYNLKIDGRDATATLLSDAEHLNLLRPGQTAIIQPRLAQLVGADTEGALVFSMPGGGERRQNATLRNGLWTEFAIERFPAPQEPGDYRLPLRFDANGKTLWRAELAYRVAEPTVYSVPVAATFAAPAGAIIDVSAKTAGHFGPRLSDGAGTLVDKFDVADARGGLTFSALFSSGERGPLVFQGNVRPAMKNAPKPQYFLAAKGKEYDGLADAWPFGRVAPGTDAKVAGLTAETTWSRKTAHYTYADGKRLDFTLSAIAPAWHAATDAAALDVFAGIRHYGIGIPAYLVYEKNGEIAVVDAKDGVDGAAMTANWILVGFNGAGNWREFDIPWLLVLQRRPAKVANTADALRLTFAGEAGQVLGMPLYGVTLLNFNQTTPWRAAPPADIIERCRFWSRALAACPKEIHRTAQVDFDRDRVVVTDRVEHFALDDDWKTEPLRLAPLPPTLPLAASSGNLALALDRPAADRRLATLHGPYVAAEGDTVAFEINGLLRFVREVRAVDVPDNEATAKIKAEINRVVASGMKELSGHPWPKEIWRGKWVPGNMQEELANLFLTLPHLEPDLRARVEKEVREEIPAYLFYDGPANDNFKERMRQDIRQQPVNVTLKSPVTGLALTTFLPNDTDYGIDSSCWESLKLYTFWDYVRTFDEEAFLKQHWAKALESFNFIPNAHDWAVSIAWDSYGGIRVGNGLQESGIMHAGMCATARLAQRLGDTATRDRAAYHAVMQLVGLQAALSANGFLRENRPWLKSHTKFEDYVYCESTRPRHYVEFVELGGFTQTVILAKQLLNSHNSYIMTPLPEIMRPYQEIWPDATDDFFDPNYTMIYNRSVAEPVAIDMFVYMITRYPGTLAELAAKRRGFPLTWWGRAADLRAELDAAGTIVHRNAW